MLVTIFRAAMCCAAPWAAGGSIAPKSRGRNKRHQEQLNRVRDSVCLFVLLNPHVADHIGGIGYYVFHMGEYM